MSILDEIRDAEVKAEEIRQQAKANAREKIKAARQEADAEHERVLAQVRGECALATKKAEDKAETYLRARIKADAENDESIIAAGRTHLSDAVKYILERVEDS
jgi:V/A-type H+-transporting ATPase subunit G/H